MAAISEDHGESSASSDSSSTSSSDDESNDRRGELQGDAKQNIIKKQEDVLKEKAAENERLRDENQIIMEQMERISNTISNKGTMANNVAELEDEIDKNSRMQKVKKNRLVRLETAHKEKSFNVKNAREIAIKAQKERVENEIKEMREEIESLDREKQFARFCKETLIIARNMKKDEEDKTALLDGSKSEEDDDDDDDEDDEESSDDEDEEQKAFKKSQENRLLHTANAIVSQNNINNELEAAILTFNLAKMKVEKDDKEAKALVERLEQVENCRVIDMEEDDVEEESSSRGEAYDDGRSKRAAMGRKKRHDKLQLTAAEKRSKISEIKNEISTLASRRVKAVKRMTQQKEAVMTLNALKAEGRKRIHSDNVHHQDLGRFKELAAKTKEMAKEMEKVLEFLNNSLLTRKRNNYVKAKQAKIKKILEEDPNAQKSGLAGMMNKVQNENQMMELNVQLKEDVKALTGTVKRLTPKDKMTAAEKMEERQRLRKLRAENRDLNRKWEKIEGGGGIEAYKQNRQVVSLNTSRLETRRKLATLTLRIQRAMGFHDKKLREEEEKRRAKGMGRVITKKEFDLMGSVKILKRQAIWWKRRLAEAMRGGEGGGEEEEGRKERGSILSAGTPSPKGFVSRLEERMRKRKESKRFSGEAKSGGAKSNEAVANAGAASEATAGDALFTINTLLATEAADKWKRRVSSSAAKEGQQSAERRGKGEGGGGEGTKKEKEKDEEKKKEKEMEMEKETTNKEKKSSPARKTRIMKVSEGFGGWGGAGGDDNNHMGVEPHSPLPNVVRRSITKKEDNGGGAGKKSAFEQMNEMLTRLKEQRRREEEIEMERKREGAKTFEPLRPEGGKGKGGGSPRKVSLVEKGVVGRDDDDIIFAPPVSVPPVDGEAFKSTAEKLSRTVKGRLDKEKDKRFEERWEELKGKVGGGLGTGGGEDVMLKEKLESDLREGMKSQDENRKKLLGLSIVDAASLAGGAKVVEKVDQLSPMGKSSRKLVLSNPFAR